MGVGSFQKYTHYNIILGPFSYRRFKTSSGHSKRILTKEKLDRQLADQSSLTPFMNIKDGCGNKKVTFDMQYSLDDKVDRLTLMMSKLTAQDDNQNKQFKSMIYQRNKENKQEISIIEIVMIREIIKIDIGLIVEIGEHHIEVEISMDKIIEEDHITIILAEMTLDEKF